MTQSFVNYISEKVLNGYLVELSLDNAEETDLSELNQQTLVLKCFSEN